MIYYKYYTLWSQFPRWKGQSDNLHVNIFLILTHLEVLYRCPSGEWKLLTFVSILFPITVIEPDNKTE